MPLLFAECIVRSIECSYHRKQKQQQENPNLILSFLSPHSTCYSHTSCQSVLKKDSSLSQKGPGQNKAWVPCSPRAAWHCPDPFSGAACDKHSCSATCAKIPVFATHPDLLWELAINTTLAEAVLPRGYSGCAAALSTSVPQPRQDKWGAESSVLFSSYRKLSQV